MPEPDPLAITPCVCGHREGLHSVPLHDEEPSVCCEPECDCDAFMPPLGWLDPPLPPMVDDIGVAVIGHGERADLDPEHPEACLCGQYEPYYVCPGPGVESLTLSIDDDGRLRAE